MQRTYNTTPSYRETSTHEYYIVNKFLPTFVIIANKCVWMHDSYSECVPLNDLSTPEEHNAFPLCIPDNRFISIQQNSKYTEYINKYKKAAADINWWTKEALSKYHHNKESHPNKHLIEKLIEQWHRAESNITRFPHFNPIGLY